MTLEEQAILSNFQPLACLDAKRNVMLVRDVQTAAILVRKTVSCNSPEIYELLKDAHIPGIPTIYHIFSEGDKVILIESYVHGMTAQEYFLDRQDKDANRSVPHTQDTAKIVDLGMQICRILIRLHSLEPPVICRDIKPSNIMIESGTWYLTDFNIARTYDPALKNDTQLLGTASFAPPEQYGFGQSDERSDIYALGVTLNVLATGKFPLESLASGRLGQIVSRATALAPQDRYQSAAELLHALERMRHSEKTSLHATLFYKAEAFFKRHKSAKIAFFAYAFWLLVILHFSDGTEVDGKLLTPFQTFVLNVDMFLLFFIPYFYNADFFGILSKTAGRFRQNRVLFLLMRVSFTVLLSVGVPFLFLFLFFLFFF